MKRSGSDPYAELDAVLAGTSGLLTSDLSGGRSDQLDADAAVEVAVQAISAARDLILALQAWQAMPETAESVVHRLEKVEARLTAVEARLR